MQCANEAIQIDSAIEEAPIDSAASESNSDELDGHTDQSIASKTNEDVEMSAVVKAKAEAKAEAATETDAERADRKVGPTRPMDLDGRQIKCVRFKLNSVLKYAWRVGERTSCPVRVSRASHQARQANSKFLAFMKKMMIRAVNNDRNLPVKLHVNDIIDMWHKQKGKCALTGIPMSHSLSFTIPDAMLRNASLDRIDPAGGYVPDNLQLVCVAANTMKWQHTNDAFIQWCRQVVRKADGLPPLDESHYQALRATELDPTTFT